MNYVGDDMYHELIVFCKRLYIVIVTRQTDASIQSPHVLNGGLGLVVAVHRNTIAQNMNKIPPLH